MNPELIERPYDRQIVKIKADVHDQISLAIKEHKRSGFVTLMIGVTIGFLGGCLWREIFNWIL